LNMANALTFRTMPTRHANPMAVGHFSRVLMVERNAKATPQKMKMVHNNMYPMLVWSRMNRCQEKAFFFFLFGVWKKTISNHFIKMKYAKQIRQPISTLLKCQILFSGKMKVNCCSASDMVKE